MYLPLSLFLSHYLSIYLSLYVDLSFVLESVFVLCAYKRKLAIKLSGWFSDVSKNFRICFTVFPPFTHIPVAHRKDERKKHSEAIFRFSSRHFMHLQSFYLTSKHTYSIWFLLWKQSHHRHKFYHATTSIFTTQKCCICNKTSRKRRKAKKKRSRM